MCPVKIQEYLEKHINYENEATKLINTLMENEILSIDNIENLREEEDDDEEPRYKDIFQWWIISDELYETCQRLKYPTIKFKGIKFWGEETNNHGHTNFFFDVVRK